MQVTRLRKQVTEFNPIYPISCKAFRFISQIPPIVYGFLNLYFFQRSVTCGI